MDRAGDWMRLPTRSSDASTRTSDAPEALREALAQRETPAACETCGGTGWELLPVDRSREYGRDFLGNPMTIWEALPCRACSGGLPERRREALRRAKVPSSFYGARMADFRWDIYKDAQGRAIDLSRERARVTSFVERFEAWEQEGMGLYIVSRTRGSGKSFLASAIVNTLMDARALGVRFLPAGELLTLAERDRREHTDALSELAGCRLLVLDDLGAKRGGGEWMDDLLFSLLDRRMQERRVTLVTSNMPVGELPLDQRITDRLYRMTLAIPLPECCIRAQEANSKKRRLLSALGVA